MEWKAFELRPDTPSEGMARPFKAGETNELKDHMKETAEAAGLVNMRRQPFVPSSRPAFEAAEYAKDKSEFERFHKATFKAFWEEGGNIGDPQVLETILKGCDLDWEDFSSTKNDGQYAQRVESQLMESRRYGITGVPAFILDRYLVSGAQPYEVFQQVMARIDEETRLKGL